MIEGALPFALTAFTTLFAIVDPVGNVGPFLGVTHGHTSGERASIAGKACGVALGVLVAFTAGGTHIFRFFGISMPAFQIAGGVLLFLVALEMLRASPRRSKGTREEQSEQRDEVAIVPLGIPLIAGPGAIASVILLSSRAADLAQRAAVYVVIALVVGLTYAVFRASDRLAKLLGRTGINVVTRLFGLLLAAIAVQFVLDGADAAWRPNAS
jgi:multiple antibiotic resistance protein